MTDGKIIWMTCRAKGDGVIPRSPCGNKGARVVRNQDAFLGMETAGGGKHVVATGGNFTTFECTKCKGRWVVRT